MIPEPDERFDVAIAGAGPAGASLALRLARAGLKVALLDAGQFPRDKLCGEFLSPEGTLALSRLGLDDGLAPLGAEPIHSVRLTTPSGRVLSAPIAAIDGRPGLGLGRAALDNLLVARARQAGAVLMERCRARGALIEGGRVVGLLARHPAIGPLAVRASAIVAADGRHSALVRQTGRTRARGWLRPRLFGLKRHLATALGPPGTVALHLVPGGYVGTCRVEGGLTNLCGLLPESAARRHRGDLDRLADGVFLRNPALFDCWTSARPAGDWKTVAHVRVEVSSPRVPGILYAGDGQGTVDPLGGQGMTMALLGAEQLAPFVVRAVVRGGATSAIQQAAQRAWHHRFDRRVRLCRLFHQALVHPALLDAASRFDSLAARILAACYASTRDVGPAGAGGLLSVPWSW
jgi:flavin-dependent dehydrogenase